MKVPYYTLSSYRPVVSGGYDNAKSGDMIDLKDFIALMDDGFISRYAGLDGTKMGDSATVSKFANGIDLGSNVTIGGKSVTYQSMLSAIKLLIPTSWTCDYFFWNVGSGSHTGLDIMMPKGTPLEAFLDGEVVRIKKWDGVSKSEGNCVVLKSKLNGNTVFVCYEHMDTVIVNQGDRLNKGDQIGTVGTTGNSTQFHLHLQIDNDKAPYHPYYSTKVSEIQTYTMDPVHFLRSVYGCDGSAPTPSAPSIPLVDQVPAAPVSIPVKSSESVSLSTPTPTPAPAPAPKPAPAPTIEIKDGKFLDLPTDKIYSDAIVSLFNKGLLKGNNGKIYPDNNISRYEFSIVLYRLIKKLDLLKGKQGTGTIKDFDDIDFQDSEFDDALDMLQKYGIMSGSGTKFNPKDNLKGEELLAVLGRLFYGLNDCTDADSQWYQTYLDKFILDGKITSGWAYIGVFVPRKEVFLILSKMC